MVAHPRASNRASDCNLILAHLPPGCERRFFVVSTEKAMKYIKRKITPADFEKQVKELENNQVIFEFPIIATGSIVPVGSIFEELRKEEEERRHNEILEAIAGKNEQEQLKQEPWQLSKISKRDRDKIIWELRNEGATWEHIAEIADCGIQTAKENFAKMKTRLISG
jgi:ERCC4-type nuclease